MIEFFTILFIDYEAPSYGMAPMASVVYATEAHCQQALDDGLADPMYDHLMSLYGDDIMIRRSSDHRRSEHARGFG